MNKIFGIGLSRTGTTSLHRSFLLLGITSKHFPMGESSFNNAIAFSDITVTIQYKELDKKYPNSKFIYTIRDIESWLKSCEYHFTVRRNLLKRPDGFLSKIRKKMYGINYFDKNIFEKAYYNHELDVTNYFKNRRNDLLTINICAGDGWEKLCPFLDLSIPNIPFPRTHVTNWINKC